MERSLKEISFRAFEKFRERSSFKAYIFVSFHDQKTFVMHDEYRWTGERKSFQEEGNATRCFLPPAGKSRFVVNHV